MMKNLTKITCRPADDKFTVLYLRDRKISIQELNLRPSKGSQFKITNHLIKSSLLSTYNDFNQSKQSLSDYFQINIIYAVNREKPDEFNLRETDFDESKEVKNSKKFNFLFYNFRLKSFSAINTETYFLKLIYHLLNLTERVNLFHIKSR